MRTLTIYPSLIRLLCHHEDCIGLRHPIVVLCHIGFIILLAIAYLYFSNQTIGQTIYFIIAIALYVSSCLYHAYRPDRVLRFVDQTMISWFTLATPVPFVYHNNTIMSLLAILAALTIANKWFEWEPNPEENHKVGTMIFFGLGMVSTFIMLTVGFPAMGAEIFSGLGLLLAAAIFFFVLKMLIYAFQWHLLPNLWEATESGHFVLAIGVTIFTFLVIGNPI